MNNQNLVLEEVRISGNYKTLLTIAYAFSIVSAVVLAPILITMAWTIPMTIKCKELMQSKPKTKNIGFGICELIFVNPISGILILVASGSVEQYQAVVANANVTNGGEKQ